jgi:hypothetical protein
MSTPVESFVTATVRGQDATTSALRSWADALQSFSGGQSPLSDMPAMVGRYFDAVQHVLDSQRQFAETLVGIVQSTQTVTNQAVRAAQDTVDAADAAASGTARMTRAAKQQTSALNDVVKAATP